MKEYEYILSDDNSSEIVDKIIRHSKYLSLKKIALGNKGYETLQFKIKCGTHIFLVSCYETEKGFIFDIALRNADDTDFLHLKMSNGYTTTVPVLYGFNQVYLQSFIQMASNIKLQDLSDVWLLWEMLSCYF